MLTQTLSVTTAEDLVDGDPTTLSLREAITQAAQIIAADNGETDVVIELSAGISPYLLTRPPDNDNDDNEEGDIDVDASGGSITIVGVNGRPTVNAGSTNAEGDRLVDDRVFHVLGGDVTFRNLVITGGRAQRVSVETGINQVRGGGVLVSSGPADARSNVLLDGVTITANTASGDVFAAIGVSAVGGGVAIAPAATVTINNSVISQNTAEGGSGKLHAGPGGDGAGGGVFLTNGGSLTIRDSIIANNSAIGGAGEDGTDGDSSFPLASSAFRGGNARGGGLFLEGGDTILQRVSFSANTAQAGDGGKGGNGGDSNTNGGNGGSGGDGGHARGGGVFLASGSLSMTGENFSARLFTGNQAVGGRGGDGGDGGLTFSPFSLAAKDGSGGRGGLGGDAEGGSVYIASDAAFAIHQSFAPHAINLSLAMAGNGGHGGKGGGDGANGGKARGGGIFLGGPGDFSLQDVNFSQNRAVGGDGGNGRTGIGDAFAPGVGGLPGVGGNAEGGQLFIAQGAVNLTSNQVTQGEAFAGAGGSGGGGGNGLTGGGVQPPGGVGGQNGGNGGAAHGGGIFVGEGQLNLAAPTVFSRFSRGRFRPPAVGTLIAMNQAEGGNGGRGGDGGLQNASNIPPSGGNGGMGGAARGGGIFLGEDVGVTFSQPTPQLVSMGTFTSGNTVQGGMGGGGGEQGSAGPGVPDDVADGADGLDGFAQGPDHVPEPIPLIATVRGQLWDDRNADGERQDEEPLLPAEYAEGLPTTSFAVELRTAEGSLLGTAFTDAAGMYEFQTSFVGDVIVHFSQVPRDFVFSPQDRGDDAGDSDVVPSTGQTNAFSLAAGAVIENVDAGLHYSPNIPWSFPQTLVREAGVFDYQAVDFDGDGDVDVVTLGRAQFNAPTIFRFHENVGDGGLVARPGSTLAVQGALGTDLKYFDIDGDEDLDLVSSGGNSPDFTPLVVAYENRGDGVLGPERVLASGIRIGEMALLDSDSDGDLDIFGTFLNAGKVARLENKGDGTFTLEELTVADEQTFALIQPADLNGDGALDFVQTTTDSVVSGPVGPSWYENNGDTPPTFTRRDPPDLGDFSGSLGASDVADLDSDGDSDVWSFVGNDVLWFENTDGEGTLAAPKLIGSGDGSRTGATADMDSDGDLDFVLFSRLFNANSSDFDGNLRWHENRGQELSFVSHVIDGDNVREHLYGLGPLQVADFDGDGELDVFAVAEGLSTPGAGRSQLVVYRNDRTDAPDIVNIAPDPRRSAVEEVAVIFPESVTGVTIDDFSLTRNGEEVDLSHLSVTMETPRRFLIDLSSVTRDPAVFVNGIPGEYALTLNLDGAGISDTSGTPLTGSVVDLFTISLGNEPPATAADEFTVDEFTLTALNVLDNDIDRQSNLDAATVMITVAPQSGAVEVQADGSIHFTSEPFFTGETFFQYTVADDQGAVSSETMVRVIVQPRNSPWLNPQVAADIDASGDVSIADLLALVLEMRARDLGPLSPPQFQPADEPRYIDANGDNVLSLGDLWNVVTVLRAQLEGEAEGESSLTDIVPLTDVSLADTPPFHFPAHADWVFAQEGKRRHRWF